MWFDSRHRDHQLHGRTGILSGPRRPAKQHIVLPASSDDQASRCCEDGRANWRQGQARRCSGFWLTNTGTARCPAGGADEAGRRGQRPGGARVAHRPGLAGALGASPRIDRAVPVSARTSTCVMAILEISPSRISVRAHIRALIRRLLGPSGRRSHPTGRRRPARSQGAGPGRRAAVVIDLALRSRGLGRAEIRAS
jgi:hypothetical protein